MDIISLVNASNHCGTAIDLKLFEGSIIVSITSPVPKGLKYLS